MKRGRKGVEVIKKTLEEKERKGKRKEEAGWKQQEKRV